jgi:opacity protein-like surface antigen
VTGGVGMVRPSLSEPGGLAKVDDMKFGWNAGGGLSGYLTDHVGIQGDVRYFRVKDDAGVANPFGIEFDGFDFVRASVGVAFKW